MSTRPRMRTTPRPRTRSQLGSLEFMKASLESVEANLFMADPRFTIVFANEHALETLRGLQD